jgi:drug/metabolite transporter (DMT)-like permease
LGLLLLGTLWGTSYLFIKVTVTEVSALTLVAGRVFFGAVLLWLILRLSGQTIPRTRPAWGAYLVMGLLSGAVPYSLITWGEQYISSGLASLLQATMPIFTVMLAHFLSQGERLSLPKAMGVGIGFVGVGALMLPDLRQGLEASALGQLAVVGSSLSYAAAAVFARERMRGQPPLASATGQLIAAAAFMVPISLVVDRPFNMQVSMPALLSWLGLVILGTVLAYILYYALIDRTSATFVSTVTYIIPVIGLFLGWLVLGEPLSLNVLLGLLLIFAGVILVRSR